MSTGDFYTRLSVRLAATSTWPAVYMFKFILPNNNRKMAMLRQIFEQEARLFEKTSSKGNYISVTVKKVMMNPDEVIACYKEVAKIEGIMMM